MIIDYLAGYPEHLPTVGKWLYEQWGRYYPDYTLEEWIKGLKTRLGTKKVPFMLVAISGNRAVGTAGIVKEDMSTHKYLSPWLTSVYVDKDYRRKKTGTRLVQRAEKKSNSMGIKKLYLYTPDMKKLYENIGWHVIEEPEYMGEKVFIMLKEL